MRVDYINIKIPILRFRNHNTSKKEPNETTSLKKSARQPKHKSYRIAENVEVGQVVFTKNGFDFGLVAEVKNGKPRRVYSRFAGYRDYPYGEGYPEYGGVNSIVWYDSGIKLSIQEWLDLGMNNDAKGFQSYWRERIHV